MPKRKVSLAEFIRDYLDEHGTAYVTELKRGYAEYCEKVGYEPTSYDRVRTTVWMLKDLGLIRPAHTEPASHPMLEDRQYYRLVPGRKDDDAWNNPEGAKYGEA